MEKTRPERPAIGIGLCLQKLLLVTYWSETIFCCLILLLSCCFCGEAKQKPMAPLFKSEEEELAVGKSPLYDSQITWESTKSCLMIMLHGPLVCLSQHHFFVVDLSRMSYFAIFQPCHFKMAKCRRTPALIRCAI